MTATSSWPPSNSMVTSAIKPSTRTDLIVPVSWLRALSYIGDSVDLSWPLRPKLSNSMNGHEAVTAALQRDYLHLDD